MINFNSITGYYGENIKSMHTKLQCNCGYIISLDKSFSVFVVVLSLWHIPWYESNSKGFFAYNTFSNYTLCKQGW